MLVALIQILPLAPGFKVSALVPVPAMLALMLMSLCAVRVRVWDDQVGAAARVMSPRSAPLAVPEVAIVTLLVLRLVPSVVAPMLLVVSAPLPLAMVKLVGSSSQVPASPFAARVLTRALSPTRSVVPEVSTWPPLPALALLAVMLPSKRVTLSAFLALLQSTTLPPSPPSSALAAMLAPACMVRVVAWCRSPLPCQSPPTSTLPPPLVPLASSAVVSFRPMSSPSRVMLPPVPRRPRVLMLVVPVKASLPGSGAGSGAVGALGAAALASSVMRPPMPPAALSCASVRVICAACTAMLPPWLALTPSLAWSAVAEASRRPASCTLALASMLKLPPCVGALTSIAPLAVCVKLPAEMAMLPPDDGSNPRASMTPLLLMVGALSVMRPEGPSALALALMLPLLSMASDALSTMRPPRCCMPLAASVPLFLTMPPCTRSSAWADNRISPPGASTADLFSTSALMVDGVTRILASVLLPSNCSSKTSPAASATLPRLATMTPLLRTSGASRAM